MLLYFFVLLILLMSSGVTQGRMLGPLLFAILSKYGVLEYANAVCIIDVFLKYSGCEI